MARRPPGDVLPHPPAGRDATVEERAEGPRGGHSAAGLGAGRVPGDVPVSTDVVEGLAGHALVEAARDARLLAVGSRTVGEIRAVLLASVSRYCAHHATCPVVVVPDVRRDPSGERDGVPTSVRTASSSELRSSSRANSTPSTRRSRTFSPPAWTRASFSSLDFCGDPGRVPCES